MNELLHGLHTPPLPTRVELLITDKDVDSDWQPIDPEATMRPCHQQLHQIDANLLESLNGDQGPAATR